jgi:hypothetical protein
LVLLHQLGPLFIWELLGFAPLVRFIRWVFCNPPTKVVTHDLTDRQVLSFRFGLDSLKEFRIDSDHQFLVRHCHPFVLTVFIHIIYKRACLSNCVLAALE